MSGLRLFVVGRTGQAAQALAEAAARDADIVAEFAGRPEIDLAQPESLLPALETFKPDVILNAAAYTAVDKAEEESVLADAVNHLGPARLAAWAADAGAVILHMSTDCVFDGEKEGAYIETDAVSPISAYGRSKADGEAAVAAAAAKHRIVRVCWVHSEFGNSFPRTMLSLAKTREEVTVVDDQFGRPTHARDLAVGLIQMAKGAAAAEFEKWGVYHLAGQGETDRASMARAIFEDSAAYGGPTASVVSVSTEAFGAPAARPLNARLNSDRAEAVFGLRLPHWRSRLNDCVRAIVMEDSAP